MPSRPQELERLSEACSTLVRARNHRASELPAQAQGLGVVVVPTVGTAAFGVGEDPRTISAVDADGVALAAIQALTARVEAQEVELAALRADVAALEAARGWTLGWPLAAGLGVLGALAGVWCAGRVRGARSRG